MLRSSLWLVGVVAALVSSCGGPPIGAEGGPCTGGGGCDPDLTCLSNVCVDASGLEGEGDNVVGEGEGDNVVGEGEGDNVVGEGEGDVVVGEGEGDVVVGEGEGEGEDVFTKVARQFVDLSCSDLSAREPIFSALVSLDPVSFTEANRQQLEALAASPNIVFDEAALLQCGNDVSCTDFQPPSCARAFLGQLPQGAACSLFQECAAGLGCAGLTSSACGVCRPLVAVGASCVEEVCERELQCDGDQVCSVPSRVPQPGDACDPVDQNSCGGSLLCDVNDLVCRTTTIAQVGEPCAPSGDGYCVNQFSTNFCSADGVCTTAPETGPCVESLCSRLTATCAATDETFTEFACTPLPAAGEPCVDRCGNLGSCVDGFCQDFSRIVTLPPPPVCQ